MSPMDSGVAPLRFSTEDLPPHDRGAVWREAVGRALMRLDFEALGTAPLRASSEQHAWSSGALCFADTNASSIARTRDLVRDGNGDYTLTLRVDGASYQYAAAGVAEDMDGCDPALFFNGAVGAVR